MPTRKTKMTCKFVSKMQDFDWDLPAEDFASAEPIALLIGGQNNDLRYLDEVEIVSPDLNCQKRFLGNFPQRIIGASAGFINGETIVCGGAIESYESCEIHKEGNNVCDRNAECATTKGGALWCTGPKTARCYTYEPIFQKV